MAWPDCAKAGSQICNATAGNHRFGTYAQSVSGLFTGTLALSFHEARAVKTRKIEIITSSPKIALSRLRIGLLFEKSQRQG